MRPTRFTLLRIKLTFHFLVISLLVFSPPRVVPSSYGCTIKYNYARVWESAVPEKDANGLIARPVGEVMQTTQYVDGLGRPFQTVSKQMSPQLKDLVSAVEYDDLGREKS